jgi:hypothetical protein
LPRTEQVRVLLEPRDKARLRDYCRKVDRTESYVGRQAIKNFLDNVHNCPSLVRNVHHRDTFGKEKGDDS